jgi:hypothetical protein
VGKTRQERINFYDIDIITRTKMTIVSNRIVRLALTAGLLSCKCNTADSFQHTPSSSSSSRQLEGSSSTTSSNKVRIKSFLSSTEEEWCLTLVPATNTIVIDECDDESQFQIWIVNTDSQLSSANSTDYCIYSNITMEEDVIMEDDDDSTNLTSLASFVNEAETEMVPLVYLPCEEPMDNNTFSYSLFDQRIRNGQLALTVPDEMASVEKEIFLDEVDSDLSGQQWKVNHLFPEDDIKLLGPSCEDVSPDGKCAVCTGDCDHDADCAGTARCAQRELKNGRENVPGCKWQEGADHNRYFDDDFCFEPMEFPGEVNYVGECDPHTYLCGECEGSCSNDHDCDPGLKCFHRYGFEAVPNCDNEAGARDMYGKSICYDPKLPIVDVDFGNPCADDNQCDRCTGDCTDDGDCLGDLRCGQRDRKVDGIPGCTFGHKKWLKKNREDDICFKPLSFPGSAGIVNYVGECSPSTYLCNRCEGGCTTDTDCAEGLTCLERHAVENVPGCFHEGGERDSYGKNICYDGDTHKPKLIWYGDCRKKFGKQGCPECKGNCKDDNDCKGSLRCANRNGLEDVPGCRWSDSSGLDSLLRGPNFCFEPTHAPGVVNYVGECYRETYLCGECEGDCIDDSHCKYGLKCMQRTAFDKVPGCTGEGGDRDMYAKGICYDPCSF